MVTRGAGKLVMLAHGDGGALSRELVATVFRPYFSDRSLAALPDATIVGSPQGRIAVTTDSFVVSPLWFAGGDIGTLAVYGTVNDLAVSGAQPQYLTAAFIIEEGLEIGRLERVAASMAAAALDAGVAIIAGDTKVVGRGQADGLFITTTGIGFVPAALNPEPGPQRVAQGDSIIVSGPVGDHGATVLAARYGLGPPHAGLASDCRCLLPLAALLWRQCPGARMMRDLTRGGLAAAAAEIALATGKDVILNQQDIPVRSATAGVARVLGVEPHDLACEGTLLAVVAPEHAAQALELMRSAGDAGAGAVIAGEVGAMPSSPAGRLRGGHGGRALLRTEVGGRVAIGDGPSTPLPRIC